MKTTEIKYTLVDFQPLFEFAYKHRGWRWGQCYSIFFGKNILEYGGESDIFWIDDLESDLKDECWGASKQFKEAIETIYSFLMDFNVDGVKFIHN